MRGRSKIPLFGTAIFEPLLDGPKLLKPRPRSCGPTQVPDLSTLPEPVLRVVQSVYGDATADLFLVGAPIALLAIIAVAFIKEKPLHTLSGDERLAAEDAAAAAKEPQNA